MRPKPLTSSPVIYVCAIIASAVFLYAGISIIRQPPSTSKVFATVAGWCLAGYGALMLLVFTWHFFRRDKRDDVS